MAFLGTLLPIIGALGLSKILADRLGPHPGGPRGVFPTAGTPGRAPRRMGLTRTKRMPDGSLWGEFWTGGHFSWQQMQAPNGASVSRRQYGQEVPQWLPRFKSKKLLRGAIGRISQIPGYSSLADYL